jgi:hypothetical protein
VFTNHACLVFDVNIACVHVVPYCSMRACCALLQHACMLCLIVACVHVVPYCSVRACCALLQQACWTSCRLHDVRMYDLQSKIGLLVCVLRCLNRVQINLDVDPHKIWNSGAPIIGSRVDMRHKNTV